MRILHTADVHLREKDDERWGALKSIVELAAREHAGALVIAGDLFDEDTDADRLRPHIRDLFSDTGSPVFLVRGNHDARSYEGGKFYGTDVHVLGEEPVECAGVTLIGLPYRDMSQEQVMARLRSLRAALPEDGHVLLVYHGELIDALPVDTSRSDFGAEGTGRYMPARLSCFAELPVTYVLAGHFHSSFNRWELPGGGWFVYPGSPISITRRETGPRDVNLFELGQPPEPRRLDTPYFETVRVTLNPFEEDAPLERVRRSLAQQPAPARVLLTVDGYFDAARLGRTEAELAARIQKISGRCADVQLTFRDISDVLRTELFQQFKAMAEANPSEGREPEELVQMAIRAMMRAL